MQESRISRSLSSGAHSRDPVAHSRYRFHISNSTSRSRRTICASFALSLPPSDIRGSSATPRGEQGMPGAWCARSPACSVESTRGSHHGHTGTPGIPYAMVLRFPSRSCVCKICQDVQTGGSHQPPVAGSEPVRAQRPREPVGERGTDPVSSSTRTVAWALSPNRARKGVDDGTKRSRCRRY